MVAPAADVVVAHLLSAPVGGALLAGYAAALVLAGALVTSRRDVT